MRTTNVDGNDVEAYRLLTRYSVKTLHPP